MFKHKPHSSLIWRHSSNFWQQNGSNICPILTRNFSVNKYNNGSQNAMKDMTWNVLSNKLHSGNLEIVKMLKLCKKTFITDSTKKILTSIWPSCFSMIKRFQCRLQGRIIPMKHSYQLRDFTSNPWLSYTYLKCKNVPESISEHFMMITYWEINMYLPYTCRLNWSNCE